jgi:hypothetical protein
MFLLHGLLCLQPFVLLFRQSVTLSSYLSIFFTKPANFVVQTYINTSIMNNTILYHPKELEYLTTEGFPTRSLFLDHVQLLEYSVHFFFMLDVLPHITL